MNNTIPKWFYCHFIILFLLSMSCTSTINLSAPGFKSRNPDDKALYRVTTTDDLRYEFKQYSISADTLVIYEPLSLDIHNRKKRAEAVTLLFDNIESIQQIGWDTKKSLYAAGIATVTVAGLILLMIAIAQPGSGL